MLKRVFSDSELSQLWSISAGEANEKAGLCFRKDCLAKADFIRREAARLYQQRTQP